MRWAVVLILLMACATPEERELETLEQRLDALIEVSLSADPLPGLLRALDDPFPEVRRFALTDLPRLGAAAEPAIPKVEALASGDPDATVRACAVDVLAALSPTGTPDSGAEADAPPAEAR